MSCLTFKISSRSNESAARVGHVTTPHGSFDTPAFMPVGTKATVKGLLPEMVADTGAQIILNNTYHLMLRPGTERIARRGGVHKWMDWAGPILTDSGGYQVFSLADICCIDDDGVTFRSEVDGSEIRLTPQSATRAQNEIGADIIMAFDDCPPAGQSTNPQRVRRAAGRTIRWLDKCVQSHKRDDQALFGIVQGGTDPELREECAAAVTEMDLPGYAIGGVAVGESFDEMLKVVQHTTPLLPEQRPRYLMGVGYERDIVESVRAGVDMFDCVLPTRNGRNANAFTRIGSVRLRNTKYTEDDEPIEPGCECRTCRSFSRSYLRHLFQSDEMLGPILVSIHNLHHFQQLMLDIRAAIRDDDFSCLRSRWPVLNQTE